MPPSAAVAFTKLVVHDLDRLVRYYGEVYGLHPVRRVQERIGDEAIEEVMLAPDPTAPFGTFVLLKYPDRPRAATGEVLLGFVTDELPALVARACAAGGRIHDAMRELPADRLRVAFVADPEGHVAELVQLLA